MIGLDLFSGYGGISYALKEWIRPAAYCEINKYVQRVLLSRMADKQLYAAPIWDDIATFPYAEFKNKIDIIYGGFPCQDISAAGLGKGLAGKQSGLYWELHKLVKKIYPIWVFLENVPSIRTKGLLTIIRSLANLGYDCRWTCLSASEVGAPHIRKRWFLLANSNSQRLEKQLNIKKIDKFQTAIGICEWPIESRICRISYGVANRVDRIKALGNGVVPLQVKTAFERLLNIEEK